MTPAKNSIRNAGFSLLIVASGLAPAFAQSALTPEQLTLRVERLTELSQRSEAKLGTIQEQLAKLNEDMSRMGRLIDNRAMLDMIQLVDQLSEEISQLNGQIEQQGFDLESIKKRQRELYLDIDRRLRDDRYTRACRGLRAAGPVGRGTVDHVEPDSDHGIDNADSIGNPERGKGGLPGCVRHPQGRTLQERQDRTQDFPEPLPEQQLRRQRPVLAG
jgi:TolA-binding protein